MRIKQLFISSFILIFGVSLQLRGEETKCSFNASMDKEILKYKFGKEIKIIGSKKSKIEFCNDLNNDGLVEIVTSLFEGEEVNYYFYQLRPSLKQIEISPLIEIRGNKHFNNKLSKVRFLDVDSDGIFELIISLGTEREYGSVYSPGNFFWDDIYDIQKGFKVSTDKYKKYLNKKKQDLNTEIETTERLLQESLKKKEKNELFSEIKIKELSRRLKTYKVWQSKIIKALE